MNFLFKLAFGHGCLIRWNPSIVENEKGKRRNQTCSTPGYHVIQLGPMLQGKYECYVGSPLSSDSVCHFCHPLVPLHPYYIERRDVACIRCHRWKFLFGQRDMEYTLFGRRKCYDIVPSEWWPVFRIGGWSRFESSGVQLNIFHIREGNVKYKLWNYAIHRIKNIWLKNYFGIKPNSISVNAFPINANSLSKVIITEQEIFLLINLI